MSGDTPARDEHGAASGAPHPPPAITASAVEKLTPEQCWALLPTAHVGRLALTHADGAPDIFPMDFVATGEHLFVRSAPGVKLFRMARQPEVAFEVEGESDGFVWSVVARGRAHRLDRDDEIEASGILSLATSSPTNKWNYVRIHPETLTGRRFRPQR